MSTSQDVRSSPATVTFSIVPPFWRTAWFLPLVALVLASVAIVFHRARLARLLALERVRTSIATDLHDDLGSTLSRISILSELARRHATESAHERILREIGETSRSLIEALGDNIWAVNPRRDHLQSLVDRVCQFAADLLEAQSIAWRLDAPADARAIVLEPEVRRHLFLILKEALNNAAKHSRASALTLLVEKRGRALHIDITDDGIGGSVAPAVSGSRSGGRGFRNMHERATRAPRKARDRERSRRRHARRAGHPAVIHSGRITNHDFDARPCRGG